MTCREFAEFMADYLADELPAPQREAFDRHLSQCVNCTRYLDGYRRTLALTKDSSEGARGVPGFGQADADVPVDVPADLVQAILRARRTSDNH